MTPFDLLKAVHMICAFLSLGGFALRGYWMAVDKPIMSHRVVKTLPHVLDTLLLSSALGMLYIWQLSPFETTWITAKILALLVYIALGMVAMRFGKTKKIRIAAWLAAMVTVIYIVSVAFTKSPWGLFAW
ncbi:MAG: SirB2 family protein [Halioglobus sp.]